MPVSDKQLAANRANATKSTGPRTPEGKARSSQNARTHGFTATTFAVVRLEELDEVARLKDDLLAVYQPVNSQELYALELIALAQQTRFRAARLECGVFINCLDMALNDDGTPFSPLPQALVGDLAVTHAQNRNYCLADGFTRMARQNNSFSLFLRYKAQAELQYRRAVEEFNRLKALRPELRKEAILEAEPEENEPDPTPAQEPISTPQPNPSVTEEAPSVSEGALAPSDLPEHEASNLPGCPTPPQPSVPHSHDSESPQDEEAPSVSEGALAPSDVPEHETCNSPERPTPPEPPAPNNHDSDSPQDGIVGGNGES